MKDFNPFREPYLSIDEIKAIVSATPGLFSFLERDKIHEIDKDYLEEIIFGEREKSKLLKLEDGTELSYDEIGDGEEVWLFFHGTRDCKHLWRNIFEKAITGCNIRIFCIDLRGHGLSSKPIQEYSFDVFLNDLKDFIYEIGLTRKPVNLIGHSMGGSIMLYYGVKYPEKVNKIITICSSLFCSFKFHPKNKTSLPSKGDFHPRTDHLINFAFPTNRKRLGDNAIKRARQIVFFQWELMPTQIHKPLITLKREDQYIWENIDNIINNKYTAICGELDDIAPADDSRKICKRIDGELIVLPDIGHYPFIEDEGLLISTLNDLFRRV